MFDTLLSTWSNWPFYVQASCVLGAASLYCYCQFKRTTLPPWAR